MKYQFDSYGYLTGAKAPNEEESFDGVIIDKPLDVDILHQMATKWNAEQEQWEFDEDKYVEVCERINGEIQRNGQISQLKAELASTDYQVIKCYESSLVGADLPYDVELLHNERQALRDKINELEASGV